MLFGFCLNLYPARLTNDRQLFLGPAITSTLIQGVQVSTVVSDTLYDPCVNVGCAQSCELLLLSKLGWDVYLDCGEEEDLALATNLNLNI